MPKSPPIQAKGVFDPRAFLGRAEAGKTIEKYQKNQKIFNQGDIADSVFFIQKGKVKVTVLSEHGKEAVVGIFAEGQFFGEGCLEGAELRTATSHHDQDRDQPSHLTSPADFPRLACACGTSDRRKIVSPRWNLPWRAKLADKPSRNRWQLQRIDPIAFKAPKRTRPFTVKRHHQHHQAAAVLASPRWIGMIHVAV
jgi:hypothetical protein